MKNDWQTPLVLLFGPVGLATLLKRRPREVVWAAVFGGWLFVMWWALTHRIDRFWVPALPVWCVLAGVGMAWPRVVTGGGDRAWQVVAWTVAVAAVVTNYLVAASVLGGNNTFTTDYATARQIAQQSNPSILYLNRLRGEGVLPADAKPLLVGEASVFDAEMPVVYNTVFDASIFQRLTTGAPTASDAEQPTADAAEVCERLTAAGVTHVLVNWGEVLRYRAPGSYGYTDYVTPRRLGGLVDAGVLAPLQVPPAFALRYWDATDLATQEEITRWGPELRRGDVWRRLDLYRVTCP